MYNKSMDKFRAAIKRKYERGFADGQKGKLNPGLTYGLLKTAYIRGFRSGRAMRDFKK